jgi:hypothetical protein
LAGNLLLFAEKAEKAENQQYKHHNREVVTAISE